MSTLNAKLNAPVLILLFLLIGSGLQAQEALKPIRKVEIGKNREFIVNDRPFLPIISWAQPPKNYPLLQKLGFNTHAGQADPALAWESGCYAVPGFKKEKMGAGNILGWIFDDEPDMPRGKGSEAKPRQEPENVIAKAANIKNSDPKRLLFMTLTGHFTKEQSTYPEEFRKKIYPDFIKGSDVIGFDIYPIYGSGYASRLDWVGKGVSQLRQLGADRPVYAWIETSKGSKWMTYEKQPDVLPFHTRNEVWQAIIRGATAIGYFTHAWFPEFKEFAATEEMQQELGRLNAQLTRLAPAILAAPAKRKIEMKLGNDLNCHFKATEDKGSVFIFAQNIDLGPGAEQAKQFDPIHPRKGTATFTVENLKAGSKIEVTDEDRTITAKEGRFTDEFAPLAEHIYRFKR
ncbi:MAG: hypothetical protein WEB30_15175 [Cyclobacteriaceae bacterium]